MVCEVNYDCVLVNCVIFFRMFLNYVYIIFDFFWLILSVLFDIEIIFYFENVFELWY